MAPTGPFSFTSRKKMKRGLRFIMTRACSGLARSQVRIDCIEELGTLDIPRYAPVIPCGDCGSPASEMPVDGVPVRPQRDPNAPVIIDRATGNRPASRNTR